jgi:hypothetical protein
MGNKTPTREKKAMRQAKVFHPYLHGRILTETIYGAWCDICDEHLGDLPNYQEASVRLTEHLDAKHYGWDKP